MFQARHASLHPDENAKQGGAGVTKAVAAKANGNAKHAANNRRALGDIGNLVRPNNESEIAKKVLPAVERPITRSFGAQLSNKKLTSAAPATSLEEVKEEQIDAVVAKNVRANAAAKDRRARTLTSTLTARSEAVCGVMPKKIEELPNIDANDVGNQLAVVEYIEDIYSFYAKTEAQSCVSPDYMTRQTSINHNMRGILVDWLIEVHLKFKLMPETLFLTTNVMDRYLNTQIVERKNLQLVGMTALLIASKYEEIWAPEVKDFVYISDNAYTREQILSMEKNMLNVLKFNLCVPTPYMFIVRLLKAAKSDHKLEMMAFFYVELCLVSFEMVKFAPSMLAASAIYTAQNTLKKPKEDCWTPLLKHHSGYSEAQLMDCARKMVTLHEKSGEGGLTVVKRKYSQEKFGAVASLSAPTL